MTGNFYSTDQFMNTEEENSCQGKMTSPTLEAKLVVELNYDVLKTLHSIQAELKSFQEKYMSERFFDRKVKEFHELRMGSMTMDGFINRFLDLLRYVSYIKEEKVKIQ